MLDPRFGASSYFGASDGSDQAKIYKSLPESAAAWETAIDAAAASAPALWGGLRGFRNWSPRAVYGGGQGASTDEILNGRSFGLSFVLAILSLAWETPVKVDVAATGVVDGNGRVGDVDGLDAKLIAVWNWAPRVRRILVPQGQVKEARRSVASLGDPPEIIGVSRAKEAIELTFPSLDGLMDEVGDRQRWVDSVFRLALGRRDELPRWEPVSNAVRRAEEQWFGGESSLSEDSRLRLRVAGAIARRHDGGRAELECAPEAWVDALLRPYRLRYLANLVQQAANCGSPSPERVLELVDERHAEGKDATAEDLKLTGALGRLHYRLGDFDEAFEFERSAAAQWAMRGVFEEVSYPLSFSYLLSGVLESGARFDELSTLYGQWVSDPRVRIGDLAFVELARGRARAMLGEFEDARQVLSQLIGQPDHKAIPDFVRYSACRWYACCTRYISGGEAPTLDEVARKWFAPVLEPLSEQTGKQSCDASAAWSYRILNALDEALYRDDSEAAARAGAAFLAEEPQTLPGLMESLELVGEDGKPDPARRDVQIAIQRYYPY
ncbi:MAG: S16 family serine protease [Persicimonas sp.]